MNYSVTNKTHRRVELYEPTNHTWTIAQIRQFLEEADLAGIKDSATVQFPSSSYKYLSCSSTEMLELPKPGGLVQ